MTVTLEDVMARVPTSNAHNNSHRSRCFAGEQKTKSPERAVSLGRPLDGPEAGDATV